MPDRIRNGSPGPRGMFRDEDGTFMRAPADWELLPPGDAGLTRRVKQGGPYWLCQEKRGRKVFSRGMWAPADRIARVREDLEAERADPAYQRRRQQAGARREKEQDRYVEDFYGAIIAFLRFHPRYAALAASLGRAVSAHATPVGSGTVARTKRIPIEQRAEAAVIAWMRHQVTDYDEQEIARIKGARRSVRADLAKDSRGLLRACRAGDERDPRTCPLQLALADQTEDI